MENNACILKERPETTPTEDTFEIKSLPVPTARKDGEVLLRTLMISVDPYMRGKMREGKSYFQAPFQVGKPLDGGVVARVQDSRSPDLAKGDIVWGFLPWQDLTVVQAKTLRKLDTKAVSIEKHMSSAGYSGLSSYLPIKHIAEPKKGETAFVTGGAGAVGSCACQILRILGCKVVTCAGSAEKVKWIKGLGFEAAFNYKDTDLDEALARYCPDGVDIYFDNVGGQMLETTLNHMNDFGRVVCCGMISQYNKKPEERFGHKNLFQVIVKRLKLQGFIMSDYTQEQVVSAVTDLVGWIKDGKLKTTETVYEGLSKVPEAFIGLFTGANLGKMLVRVAE